MSESFDSVNTYYRYLEPVLRQDVRVTFDINFFQRVEVRAAGPDHFCFHFFTKMTTGSGIENYAGLGFQTHLLVTS